MSDYSGWESLPNAEIRAILTKLKHLLEHLPTQLPLRSGNGSMYAVFANFSLDPELMEKTGCEISTFSEQLKRVFGWQTRSTGDGIIDICERGPGICVLHRVFSRFLDLYPDNNFLRNGLSTSRSLINSASQSQKRPRSESSGDALPAAKSNKTVQQFISILKGIIKHFSKSSYSTEKLREQRNIAGDDGAVRALQKIGKTRFGTHWMASTSLDVAVLRDIVILVSSKVIKFKNTRVQGLLMNGRFNNKFAEFEQKLQWYIIIIAPLIRSLWSLEAAHANASDVFVFWLAMAATLKDLFSKEEETGLPRAFANNITDLFNKRYHEFFKNNIYFTAFMLDPRYRKEDFLKLTLNIPPANTGGAQQSEEPMSYYNAYMKVKSYLGLMLRGMLEWIAVNPGKGNPVLAKLGPVAAVQQLKRQLIAYWKCKYPFDSFTTLFKPENHSLEWRRSLLHHPDAQALAMLGLKIFSILVNSMPDERINSTITWMNSPNRGRQNVRTLVDRIQVGQWYRTHEGDIRKKTRHRPAVKFRKIDKATLLKLQIDENEDEEGSKELDDSDGEDDGPVAEQEGERDERLLTSTATSVLAVTSFDIDPNIDLNSKALIDMISEEAVVSDKPAERTVPEVHGQGKNSEETVESAFADF